MSIILNAKNNLEKYFTQKFELLTQLKSVLLRKEMLLENEEFDLIQSFSEIQLQIMNKVDELDEQVIIIVEPSDKDIIKDGFKEILSEILLINDRIIDKTKVKHSAYEAEMQKIGQARKLAQGNLGYINSYDQALQTSYYIDKKK